MRTNVQTLRDLSRWNVFEFKDNKYVPVFPFAGTWIEMYLFLSAWPFCFGDTTYVILPYGCSF